MSLISSAGLGFSKAAGLSVKPIASWFCMHHRYDMDNQT